MKFYFAGSGSLKKKDIKKTNKLIKRRLLSFYFLKYDEFQKGIFKSLNKLKWKN